MLLEMEIVKWCGGLENGPVNMVPYMAKGSTVRDEIKVASQLTIKWGDHPGLSGWTQCNHKCL